MLKEWWSLCFGGCDTHDVEVGILVQQVPRDIKMTSLASDVEGSPSGRLEGVLEHGLALFGIVFAVTPL